MIHVLDGRIVDGEEIASAVFYADRRVLEVVLWKTESWEPERIVVSDDEAEHLWDEMKGDAE